MGGGDKRRVLIIGGSFSGLFSAKDLKKHFHVTIVDAKEFFEYTPGVLRCFVKPSHFDSLSFTLQPVIERTMGVKFIWGEVLSLKENNTALVKTMFSSEPDCISFDYCMICAGCNFGPFKKNGESLWFPVIHEEARKTSDWAHIDERFIEGRRRHILEEYHKIGEFNKKGSSVLVVGAGFIGVEWATELEYFFPELKITIIDFLPRCLGPLPDGAAEYCSEYMHAAGIREFYNMKYDANKGAEFLKQIEMPDGPDLEYVCIGVKASNFFMPPETLSKKGPGGGGWIHFNTHMQVTLQPDLPGGDGTVGKVWGNGSTFAVGDCNYGVIGNPDSSTPPGQDVWAKVPLPPIPKISYPGEEQALHALRNLERLDKYKYGGGCFGGSGKGDPGPDDFSKFMQNTWWPWGAGMFATSLGPHDACFVCGANHIKNSGYTVNWWLPAAIQKEFIETTKVDECRDRWIGTLIWYFVHHTPVHLWGAGRFKKA